MSLRVTIVGCGAVAQRLYRKPLQRLERRGMLQVASLVDTAAANARALLSFFPQAKVYGNLEDALTASGSELALILTPANLHRAHAIQALRYRNHVLCEKPMALSTADCVQINAAAAEAKRVLAIGMVRRFFPAFAQFKRIIDDELLGSLLSFEYREGYKFEWEVTTPAAFEPRSRGGTGVLFDIGPHVIDYVAWTLGDLKVLAYSDDALKGIESNVSLEVESRACPGMIQLSWDCPQANEFRVVGSKGEAVLRVDRFDQLAMRTGSGFEVQDIRTSFPADALPTAGSRMSPKSYAEAIYCQLVQVVRAIQLGERPAVDGEEGARCIALLESALAVAQPLEMPWLDSLEGQAFRQMHWTNNP